MVESTMISVPLRSPFPLLSLLASAPGAPHGGAPRFACPLYVSGLHQTNSC